MCEERVWGPGDRDWIMRGFGETVRSLGSKVNREALKGFQKKGDGLLQRLLWLCVDNGAEGSKHRGNQINSFCKTQEEI